jgi:PAS domain S-box-containing protein
MCVECAGQADQTRDVGHAPALRKVAMTRVIGLSFACAAVAAGSLWLVHAATMSEARSWRAVEHLEPWGRTLLGRLSGARSDLTDLGASAAALTDADSSPRPELIRALREFLSLRPWCRGILVAPAAGQPLLVLATRGEARCDPGYVERARLVDEAEGFLARGSGAPPRLCLGVAIGGPAGPRGAVLAEVDPAALFGGLEGNTPAAPRPLVSDGAGRVVIGQPAGIATSDAVGLAVKLSGWRGPAAGTWRVSTPASGVVPLDQEPRLLLAGGLLLALALTAGGLARAAGGRRWKTRPEPHPDRVQLLTDSEPRPLVLQDRHGAYLVCNAAFEAFVGRSRREIIGRTAFDVMPPVIAESDHRVDLELLASGGCRRYETRALDARGVPRTLLVSKAAVPGDDGRLAGTSAIFIDVTGQGATEVRRRQGVGELAVGRQRAEGEASVRSPAPGGPRNPQPALPARPSHHWRALVAEDNPVSQRVAAARLRRLGGEVDVAANGQEAMDAVSARRYDVVFMDCRMPGVDGYAATRGIRRREGPGSHIPIVAVTANASVGDRDRCLAAGMDDYLAKPVRSHELRQAIDRHVLGAKHGHEEPFDAFSSHGPLGAIDVRVLARLQALDAEGTPGFLAELIRDFDLAFHEQLAEMRTAVRNDDARLLESAAHKLKGSAAVLGARALAERCGQLERLARRGAAAEATRLVDGLPSEHASVMSSVRAAAAAEPAKAPVASTTRAPSPARVPAA